VIEDGSESLDHVSTSVKGDIHPLVTKGMLANWMLAQESQKRRDESVDATTWI
jgi:hypothetical protein